MESIRLAPVIMSQNPLIEVQSIRNEIRNVQSVYNGTISSMFLVDIHSITTFIPKLVS